MNLLVWFALYYPQTITSHIAQEIEILIFSFKIYINMTFNSVIHGMSFAFSFMPKPNI